MVKPCLWLRRGFLEPNPASGHIADFQSRILVTVPNAFSDSSFINPSGAHTVFERFTEKEWHNPLGTSNGRGDLLEQRC